MRAGIFALVGTIALAGAGSANAQSHDEAAVVLREQVKAGDRVTLSLTDRIVTGKLIDLEPYALLVLTDSGGTRVPFESVRQVQRKRMGLRLGTAIGAGVGIVPAWAMASWASNEGANAAIPAVLLIGGGAAIGAAIDALLNLNRMVYRRTPLRP